LSNVDRVDASGDLGQLIPVARIDLDHVVDAWVIRVLQLGKAKVRALSGVTGDDVVDDRAAVPVRSAAHLSEFILGAEGWIDLRADAIEVAVDARGLLPARDPAGTLDRAGVNRLDANLGEGLPHVVVGHRLEEGLVRTRDQREWVSGEPHRCRVDGTAWIRGGVRVLPHRTLPRELLANRIGIGQH
jgi:hypothetical protein